MKAGYYFLALIMLNALVSSVAGADEPIDARKLRQLHQQVKAGHQLTPKEQAYYGRGKAARQSGEAPEKSTVDAPLAQPAKTSTGLIPLCDMSAGDRYKGQDGGLYGAGRNTPPEAHLKAALAQAASIQPLDAAGKPSSKGKIVLLTHGMSNTTMESQCFLELANAEPRKNPAVVLVDGAQGGIDARKWVNDTHTRRDTSPWDTLASRLRAAQVTPAQVQVVWMKHALARVGAAEEFPKHAQQLTSDWAEIIGMLKQRCPNLKLAYLSSRSYAGYASTVLSPEPYAYEGAFAVRWLIQDQIKSEAASIGAPGTGPVLLWGPYLWADGVKGRKAGDLAYQREDYGQDGTHPTTVGRQKVAEQLLKFFTTDPTAKQWFLEH